MQKGPHRCLSTERYFIYPLAVDRRVGDDTLGDDANDVAEARAEAAAENNRRTGSAALQPRKHQAEKVLVSANDEPLFGKDFDGNLRLNLRLDQGPNRSISRARVPLQATLTSSDDASSAVGASKGLWPPSLASSSTPSH
jgi:hypothetical protein